MSEIFWEAKDKDEPEKECKLRKIDTSLFILSVEDPSSWGYPTVSLDRKDLKDLYDAIEHLMGWRDGG